MGLDERREVVHLLHGNTKFEVDTSAIIVREHAPLDRGQIVLDFKQCLNSLIIGSISRIQVPTQQFDCYLSANYLNAPNYHFTISMVEFIYCLQIKQRDRCRVASAGGCGDCGG